MAFNTTASREAVFSEKETAQMLGISPSFLRLLRYGRKIGCYKFGGRVVYAQRHVDQFKQASEQQCVAA